MESNTNITVTTTEVDQGGPSFKRPLPLSERDCNTQKIIRLEDITLLAAPQEEHIQHDVEVSDIFKPSGNYFLIFSQHVYTIYSYTSRSYLWY